MGTDDDMRRAAIKLMHQLNLQMKIELNSSHNFLNPGPLLVYVKKYFDVWETYQDYMSKEEFLRYSRKWIYWYAGSLATVNETLKDLVIGNYDYNVTRQKHLDYLKWIHAWDEEFSHQLMNKHPGAYSAIEEEWAIWTRLII